MPFSLYWLIFLILVIYLVNAVIYWTGTYYKSTHKSFLSVLHDKGAFGEYLIYFHLRPFEAVGARFLFNCYIPTDGDGTSEVDVLMISRSGVYVFESKNFSGWIFGSEFNKTWTQTLPNGRGSQKEHFYNPIMQNKTHIKWLERQLDQYVIFHNVIVFSDRCELKKLDVSSSDVSVIRRHDIFDVVKYLDENVGNRYDENIINTIYEKLYPSSQVSLDVKARHVSCFRSNSGEVFSMDRCPRCGGRLVLRTARRGAYAGNSFYGCSNYPHCRYIRNIDL